MKYNKLSPHQLQHWKLLNELDTAVIAQALFFLTCLASADSELSPMIKLDVVLTSTGTQNIQLVI